MPRSLPPIGSALAVLALCACGVFGGDAPEGGPADADLVVDSAAPDTTGTLESAAAGPPAPGQAPAGAAGGATAEPSDAAAPETAPDQALTVDERLDRLLESQEAINRRLDSLTAAASPTGSASGIAGSGQVLGQAGESVRNFGVAVVWSILAIALFNFAIRLTVWVLDALAERNASRRLFYKRIVPIARIVLWTFAAYLIVAVIFQVDAQGLFAAAAAIGVAVGSPRRISSRTCSAA
jgi:hypothetical protein